MAPFGIFYLLSKEQIKRLFSRTLRQKCKNSDWDFDIGNQACSYGEISQWSWRWVANICTLEPSDYKNSGTKNRKNGKGFSTEHYCKSLKISRGYLPEEITPVVTNICEFENWDMSKLKRPVVFRTIRILLLGKNQMLVQPNSTLLVYLFRLRPWRKNPNIQLRKIRNSKTIERILIAGFGNSWGSGFRRNKQN